MVRRAGGRTLGAMNPRSWWSSHSSPPGLCASAGSAEAAGCTGSYSGLTHKVMVQSCVADPDAPVVATISRTPEGAILLDGNAIAGDPTVANTDAIVYEGDGGQRRDHHRHVERSLRARLLG